MPGDGLFDEGVAARYDAEHPGDAAEVAAAVALLAELAGSGPALEFAIGTGRLALPLARTGVSVEGIELSRAMVARLREKPGGASIPVAIGDMATVRVEGRFALVYLAFNTINNLTAQATQVACFRNAAAHLDPGGCFLVEVSVPPLQHLPPGETRLAFARSDMHWGIDEIDVVSQNFVSHHVFLRDGAAERRALPMRYVWPAELDLMAELAGLRPKARWADWSRMPFTATSRSHVSVWEKQDG